jgi:acylphosphatase
MPAIPNARVTYHGHVQGVGFRYAVLEVAREFEVSGYVQNLADGRVLLEAEGEASQLRAFLAAVEEKMDGYIRSAERAEGAGPPRHQGFVIR